MEKTILSARPGRYRVKMTFLSDIIEWDGFEYVPHQRIKFFDKNGMSFECPQNEVEGIMYEPA